MTWPALVAEHDGHWLRFDGPDAVRCHPCSMRLLLPLRPELAATPAPPALHAPDRCQTHPGQRAGTCGACRADVIADEQRDAPTDPDPTSDSYALGAAAARAALVQVAARRRQPEENL